METRYIEAQGPILSSFKVPFSIHWQPPFKAHMKFCSVLEKSPFGAKSDFEIWAFKGFLYLDKKISPKKGLKVSTPKNLKWKKCIRQSENANGRHLEPLWGSK